MPQRKVIRITCFPVFNDQIQSFSYTCCVLDVNRFISISIMKVNRFNRFLNYIVIRNDKIFHIYSRNLSLLSLWFHMIWLCGLFSSIDIVLWKLLYKIYMMVFCEHKFYLWKMFRMCTKCCVVVVKRVKCVLKFR